MIHDIHDFRQQMLPMLDGFNTLNIPRERMVHIIEILSFLLDNEQFFKQHKQSLVSFLETLHLKCTQLVEDKVPSLRTRSETQLKKDMDALCTQIIEMIKRIYA